MSAVHAGVEHVLRGALATLARRYPDVSFPGVELLTERTELAGPDFTAHARCRVLPTADGHLALSLARDSDLDLLPALVEHDVDEPWAAVESWASTRSSAQTEQRALLLGLPAAAVPDRTPPRRRAPVVVEPGGVEPGGVEPGGARGGAEQITVVDLSALWAGPLCARLLGLTGARIVKVESSQRPDGARFGPPLFYERMHAGHESVVLDFATDAGLVALRQLLASAAVVIEASRPRALQQLGIRAEQFVEAGCVWVSITAYGRQGADAMRVGFGDDIAAGAGLVDVGKDGTLAPLGDAIADPLSGTVAAAAAADALASGRGALLDVSMHDVAVEAACWSPQSRDS
jgi:crotonobetainyl-CoA:carnitine CoA-transferase CaiB-like acyl-CoA transferase